MSDLPPILFGEPWFDQTEVLAVQRVIESRWIGQGPVVENFERNLAAYVDAAHCVAVASCTGALSLSLATIGVGPGDEVITTPFTFVATINAIEHQGATPVLVDIDRDTLAIDAGAVAGAITERTRAVMPVHFGGRPLDLEAFHALIDRAGLWLIEDAAHAIGARSGGRRVGSSHHPRALTCFSFYPNKNLATAEGGAITTGDDEVAARLGRLRLHGLDNDAWKRYRDDEVRYSLAVEAGYKENWTDLQAAIAQAQLDKLEGFLAVREYLADRYDELLDDVPGATPVNRLPPTLRDRHALHLYQIAIDGPDGRRNAVLSHMRNDGIGAAIHYIGVNQHPAYAPRFTEPYPASDWASSALLTLPLHLHLSTTDVGRVVDSLRRALAATG